RIAPLKRPDQTLQAAVPVPLRILVVDCTYLDINSRISIPNLGFSHLIQHRVFSLFWLTILILLRLKVDIRVSSVWLGICLLGRHRYHSPLSGIDLSDRVARRRLAGWLTLQVVLTEARYEEEV